MIAPLLAVTLAAVPDFGATSAYRFPPPAPVDQTEYWHHEPWVAATLGTVPSALCFHVPTLLAPNYLPLMLLSPLVVSAGQWYNGDVLKALGGTVLTLPVLAGGFIGGSIVLGSIDGSVGAFNNWSYGVYGANFALAVYEGLLAWDAYATAETMNRDHGLPLGGAQ